MKYNQERTIRLRLCEEADDALHILKDKQPEKSATEVINDLILTAAKRAEENKNEVLLHTT